MKILANQGDTSNLLQLFIQDMSSTIGSGLVGLTFASFVCYYKRNRELTPVSVPLRTMTPGVFTPSGFIEVDSVKMPGWYEFCPPDQAYASGSNSLGITLYGAPNSQQMNIEIQLGANVSIGNSGITNNSFMKRNELTNGAPSFPCTPLDEIDWIFTRSKHKTRTQNNVDYVYMADTQTILSSGQTSDDTITFTRGAYS
jgi:hypothetical protein